MRKLGMALALAAAALFSQGVRAEDAGDKAKKAGNDAAGETRKEAQRTREAGDRALHGSGSAGSSDMKAQENRSAATEKKHPLFDGKHNFDVDGKVQSASKDSITISREDLPPATLHVATGTKIERDGKAVSAEQLKPGEDVKASFNLNKDKPEAVEIKAKLTDTEKDAKKRTEKAEKRY